jgi:Flp pilus assembly protein protease CpaA
MLVFSWTGLGYLAPALMLVPYFIVYQLMEHEVLPSTRLWPYLGAAGLCFALTFYVGRWLNRGEVRHRLCELRFENWAWIQLGLACAIYGLFWLGSGDLP